MKRFVCFRSLSMGAGYHGRPRGRNLHEKYAYPQFNWLFSTVFLRGFLKMSPQILPKCRSAVTHGKPYADCHQPRNSEGLVRKIRTAVYPQSQSPFLPHFFDPVLCNRRHRSLYAGTSQGVDNRSFLSFSPSPASQSRAEGGASPSQLEATRQQIDEPPIYRDRGFPQAKKTSTVYHFR